MPAESTTKSAPAPAAEPTSPAPVPASRAEGVVPFNLRQPSFLSASEQRRLRQRHEEFVSSLATRLSLHLRLEIAVRLACLDTLFYPQFIERLPNPSQLALFRIDGLSGFGLIEISPRLGIALVDRVCGGAGRPFDLGRDLSEIEVVLLDQIISVVLNEWVGAVAALADPKIEMLTHETHARFLQPQPDNTRIVALGLEMQWGENKEQLHVGLPFEMIESLLRAWNQPMVLPTQKPGAARTPVKWNPALNAVRVALSATWDGLEITARKLTQLKPGDTLSLNAAQINRTIVSIGRIPKFVGRLGRVGDSWAVELNEPVKT